MFAAAFAAAPARTVPSFDCPDADIVRTYEYRWRAFARHITVTPEGQVVTEFLPKVPWAGKYNTIVCPAGHHLREARWMHDPSVAADDARFWFGTNGVHRFKYSTWLASAILDVVRVTGETALATDLLDRMVETYETWEMKPILYDDFPRKGKVPMGGDGKGLFISTDNREGSEYSLGGSGYRPLFNSAMYGEARAISEIARLAGRADLAERFAAKAVVLEDGIKGRLWNPERDFFTTVRTDGMRTAVRELHGYAPWYFNMPLVGYGRAWEQLLDEKGFAAPLGLAFPERRAPGFKIAYSGHECQWNGPSWPFATSIALTGLAHAIAEGSSGSVGKEDFARLLKQYAAQQVRRTDDGRMIPWVDEDIDPFTGEWVSRKILKAKGATGERGEDYNHSTFADLVIAGLCGLHPRLDGSLELRPLIPDDWDYLKLEDVRIRGRRVSLYWDRTGSKYGKGAGFSVWADGKEVRRFGRPRSCLLFGDRVRTAGWGDGTASREDFYPYAGIRWRGDGCNDSAFTVRKLGGAEGEVKIRDGEIRIVKTNEKGYIVVEGPAFAAAKANEWLRLAADVEVEDAIGDSCHGFVRAYGERLSYGVSELFERDYSGGGIPYNWGLPESPKGRTYRKYAPYVAKDRKVVPVLIVTGGASVSTWRNWVVMDMAEETRTWRKRVEQRVPKIRDAERQDEATYDAELAKDIQHTAKVVRENGVSRLYVDGRRVAPVAYKGRHASGEGIPPERFAGGTLQGTGIPFAVKDIRLGKVPGSRGYWTKDGFDAKGAVLEIKNSMRLAPTMPFVLAIGCNAYPEFAREEHPEEAMRRADGSIVLGTSGSCLPTYCIVDIDNTVMWPWPSYSSRIWREGVKTCLRELVAELKRQNLDRRIVGIHTFGYHDGQFTSPFADHSPAAKAEYAEYLKESGHASTNYEFFALQTGLRAQEEFVREFKRLLGKDAIGIMWCESPLSGKRAVSYNLGGFLRSDAMDILVAQPCYVHRLPGVPGGNRLPTASFNLHGKLYFEELDFRTYASFQQWTLSPAASKGLGVSEDFPMWQTVFRKNAGAMVAQRAGWWFYDMAGGWFSAPEIVDDIRTALKGYDRVWSGMPSSWKPGVALVVDEAGPYGWAGGEGFLQRPLQFSHYEQLFLLARSGVPFDVYLAQDVLEKPSLVEPYRMIAFGLMRKYDDARIAFVKRLARDGRTLVHLPRCGELGGLDAAAGFRLSVNEKADHTVVAEPSFPEEVNGLHYHDMLRNCGTTNYPPAHLADWPRNSIVETKGVRVLARYLSDGAPAIAAREGGGFRQVVFTEAGGVSGGAFNRLAVEAGAYVALPTDVAEVDMNGDFVSVHALRNGDCDFRLPFDCAVENLKTGRAEPVVDGCLRLRLDAGDTCQFLLRRK